MPRAAPSRDATHRVLLRQRVQAKITAITAVLLPILAAQPPSKTAIALKVKHCINMKPSAKQAVLQAFLHPLKPLKPTLRRIGAAPFGTLADCIPNSSKNNANRFLRTQKLFTKRLSHPKCGSLLCLSQILRILPNNLIYS